MRFNDGWYWHIFEKIKVTTTCFYSLFYGIIVLWCSMSICLLCFGQSNPRRLLVLSEALCAVVSGSTLVATKGMSLPQKSPANSMDVSCDTRGSRNPKSNSLIEKLETAMLFEYQQFVWDCSGRSKASKWTYYIIIQWFRKRDYKSKWWWVTFIFSKLCQYHPSLNLIDEKASWRHRVTMFLFGRTQQLLHQYVQHGGHQKGCRPFQDPEPHGQGVTWGRTVPDYQQWSHEKGAGDETRLRWFRLKRRNPSIWYNISC